MPLVVEDAMTTTDTGASAPSSVAHRPQRFRTGATSHNEPNSVRYTRPGYIRAGRTP